MRKKSFLFTLFVLISTVSMAQEENNFLPMMQQRTGISSPFLYSETILTSSDQPWSVNYLSSYGERVEGQFGYDGVEQYLSVKGYIANNYTLLARASFGFGDGGEEMVSAQQVEVLRDIITKENFIGLRLGAGLGFGLDYSNTKLLLSRIVISLKELRWSATGNLFFEKALASDRDAIDLIMSGGIHYQFSPSFAGGIEAVCEDVEGFWDENEAEGGAKLFIGPTINYSPVKSRLSFSFSGGPVIYATSNQNMSAAVRELPTENGLTVRAKVTYSL